MRKNRWIVALCSIALVLGLISCSKPRALTRPNPADVIAHTDGLIQRSDVVSVVLSKAPDKGIGSNPFSFQPAVAGTARWSDDGTRIDFKPDAPFIPGKKYRVTFDFSKLGYPEKGYFNFAVGIALPDIKFISEPAMQAVDEQTVMISGAFSAYAIESSADVEALFSARLGKTPVAISWSHPGDNQHVFTIKSIARGKNDQTLTLTVNTKKVHGKFAKVLEFKVPKEGSFALLEVQPASGSTGNAIALNFSEPLEKSQDLRGLIDVKGMQTLRYDIEGSTVRVYSDIPWPKTAEVTVNEGVRSISNKYIATKVAASVSSGWEIPALEFENSGVIIPTTQGTKIVLKTKNLSKVYIEALQVYGSNMLQFLQVNDLTGSSELKRVGDVVWSKVVDLPWDDSKKNTWVTHVIDIGPLLAKNPGGMFQIRATFTKDFIQYESPNAYTSFGKWKFPPLSIDGQNEQSYWDYYEYYDYDYDYDYDYSDYDKISNDPIHPAFYYRYKNKIIARKNVLVSDVGLNAKIDTDGAIHVFAGDLRTTKPLAGLSVQVYSYSAKLLSTATLDKNGAAVIKVQSDISPMFILTKGTAGDSQNGYLKLTKPLSVSHFEIGGEEPVQGVKGFLYAERGIWRPGDDIHLVFVLQDLQKKIPKDHPVEFSLINPRGQNVQSAVYTDSVNGFYYIKTGTASDAPTGNYVAEVKIGNSLFTKVLKVESIMPNRLKMNLSFGADAFLTPNSRSVMLEAQWLHGAPASNLRADVSIMLELNKRFFATSYPDYSFYDPRSVTTSSKEELWNGFLDANGKKEFSVSFDSGSNIYGPCTAYVFNRVFEESGLFSSETSTVTFHPFEQYVGIRLPSGDKTRNMLLTDKDHQVELLLVDRSGKPVSSGKLSVEVYQLEWRWWFEKSASEESEVSSSEIYKKVASESIAVSNGKAIYKLRVNYPNWGRYLIIARDEKEGHITGKTFYIDWPGWAGKGREGSGDSSMMLSLTADKEVYKVGDRIQVLFPSNQNSAAYITIERSGTILKEEWVTANAENTVYSFVATADMSPNVYVHVTYVQPHLQTQNDLPIRLYGVIPVMVENPVSRLDPRITMPETLEPLTKSQFTVYEQNGRAMTYTVAVVDEGLLGLTKYTTPNPWDSFYKKEASRLVSYDIYRDVANAFSGALQSFLTIGGGDSADQNALKKVNRFPPVVKFYGPFMLERGQKKTHDLELGQYVGAVRYMIVSGTPEGAYGKWEKEVQVKSSLMTFITAPRFVAPKEKISIPVTVFSYLGKNAQVAVTLSVKGPASVTNSDRQILTFAQDGDMLASFDLQTMEQEGTIVLEATAAGANGKSAKQTITLPIQSPSIAVTTTSNKLIGGKSKATIDLKLPGIPGSNAAWLELSLLPPIDLSKHLSYLIGYPHGCGEQRTSKMFPQLFLPNTVNLTKQEQDAIRSNISSGIKDLQLFQKNSGGFVFWQGSYDESTWLSAYIAHFLIMAQKTGYVLPSGMLSGALKFLSEKAKQWNAGNKNDDDYSYYGNASLQSYILYVLALGGKAEIGAMNRLAALDSDITTVRLQLAAAYALAGVKQKAMDLLVKTKYNVWRGQYYMYTYGSELREKAMVLDCLNALGDTSMALPLFKDIAETLSNENYYFSTQDLAFSLIAIQPFMQSQKKDKVKIEYQEKGLGPQTIELTQSIVRVPLSTSAASVSVTINNIDAPQIYARVIATGMPLPGSEPPVSNGLSINATYYDTSFKSLDPSSGYRGQDMIVKVSVNNTSGRDLKNVAVTYRVPSGWEILNERIANAPDSENDGDGKSPLFFYKDIRDDRVMFYADFKRYEKKDFLVYVNRTYGGMFYLPAVIASAMYEPEVQAVLPGRLLPLIINTTPILIKPSKGNK